MDFFFREEVMLLDQMAVRKPKGVLKVPPIYKSITPTQPRGFASGASEGCYQSVMASTEPRTWPNHWPIRPNPHMTGGNEKLGLGRYSFLIWTERDAIEVEDITIAIIISRNVPVR